MTENSRRKKLKIAAYALVLLVAGFGAGYWSYRQFAACDTTGFTYINLDFICQNKPVVAKYSYVALKNDLEDLIQQKKDDHAVTDVSVYFRDLQNGPTFGIDEHATFVPASLLKLPLLIAYYNLRDNSRPSLFSEPVVVKNLSNDLKQMIPPKESAVYGDSYTVGDLLNLMIKDSDNNSYYALSNYLDEISPKTDLQQQTLVDLGIIEPSTLLDNTVSVKAYGSIFTQLYNASYFSNEKTSDEVLNLLTETDWKDGINQGVPPGVTVAHKFGEREDLDNGVIQLHDCGIIYYPGNPYLLCVMTRGYDIQTLSGMIGTISKMTYDEFNSRKL